MHKLIVLHSSDHPRFNEGQFWTTWIGSWSWSTFGPSLCSTNCLWPIAWISVPAWVGTIFLNRSVELSLNISSNITPLSEIYDHSDKKKVLSRKHMKLTHIDIFRANSHHQFSNRSHTSINQVHSIDKLNDSVLDRPNSQAATDAHHRKQTSTLKETSTHKQTITMNEQLNTHSATLTSEQSLTSTQAVTMNEAQQLLPKANSFSSISTSDSELKDLNQTSTTVTLFPSPSPTLPAESARHEQTVSLDMNATRSNGSLLVSAYSTQEKEKFSTVHQLT